jgi:hypothetical protein
LLHAFLRRAAPPRPKDLIAAKDAQSLRPQSREELCHEQRRSWLDAFYRRSIRGGDGTPAPILAKLRAEVNAVLALPKVAERLVPAGAGEPYITTLDEFNAIIRRDYEMYGKVIKDVGVTVD